MFSHLTDRELAIYAIVIAIFTIKPIPLFPHQHPCQKVSRFQTSQYIQPDRASLT
jgi:hypothetical protein